jgi:biopolymer transport protein ExbD
VIQPRVQHGVAINIPQAQQLRRVEQPPIPVSVEQARVVDATVHRVRVEQNVGQIVRNRTLRVICTEAHEDHEEEEKPRQEHPRSRV